MDLIDAVREHVFNDVVDDDAASDLRPIALVELHLDVVLVLHAGNPRGHSGEAPVEPAAAIGVWHPFELAELVDDTRVHVLRVVDHAFG